MTDLTSKKCQPCEGGVAALRGKELERLHAQLPGWTVEEGKRLVKEYRFPDFRTALAFVNRVGELAESEGHHPDVELGWGRVKITLWTHSIGGLSENDFILAAKADQAL
jgi:4a-hydroxytetrahydrobiopterin dehydratase